MAYRVRPFARQTRALRLVVLLSLLGGLLSSALPRIQASPLQPTSISYWGMNGYITKRERLQTDDNISTLIDTAYAGGARWTREEFPWALIEPNRNDFRTTFDGPLRPPARKGFGIIGMLLTTPAWARDGSCRPDGAGLEYWCPPANPNDYARFASWMVERYDGDGVQDAPESPRVAAWEIWNEPNDTLVWPNIGSDGNARKRRYGEMLVLAYNAIKAADPTALVLIGGVYIYDGGCTGVCDGFNFLNAAGGVFQQVPEARQAFDVFSIHPYIPTNRPDAPEIPRIITVEGRIRNSRAWLDHPAINRPNVPIWITEMGWCTSGGTCPGGVAVSEDMQANFLTRSMVIAQQNGVQHTSWFQLEDAFDDPGREWSYAAILRQFDGSGYPVKPAYHAYRTLFETLSSATPAGFGPLNTHSFDLSQPINPSGNGTYDYRYQRNDGALIDVLWLPNQSEGTRTLAFPVEAGRQVVRIDRDGGSSVLSPVNGAVTVTINERPFFLLQQLPPQLAVNVNPLGFLAQPNSGTVCQVIQVSNSGSGTLTWTASGSGAWLSITGGAGGVPGQFTACADTNGRSAGSYSGSVQVVGSNGSGTITIPATLVISNQLRRIYLPLERR